MDDSTTTNEVRDESQSVGGDMGEVSYFFPQVVIPIVVAFVLLLEPHYLIHVVQVVLHGVQGWLH